MIGLAADHGGFKIKEEIKKYFEEKDIQFIDYGTFDEERTDYPIYAEKLAKGIQRKECELGIAVCKSAAGMTCVTNKFKGIRCAAAFNEEMAKFAKADDNINVLAIPADYLSISQVVAIIRVWLATEFKEGRYAERLQMIENIEKNEMK